MVGLGARRGVCLVVCSAAGTLQGLRLEMGRRHVACSAVSVEGRLDSPDVSISVRTVVGPLVGNRMLAADVGMKIVVDPTRSVTATSEAVLIVCSVEGSSLHKVVRSLICSSR